MLLVCSGLSGCFCQSRILDLEFLGPQNLRSWFSFFFFFGGGGWGGVGGWGVGGGGGLGWGWGRGVDNLWDACLSDLASKFESR